MRKGCIEGILGTDMTRHVPICGQFEDLLKKIKAGKYDKSVEADRDVR